MKLKNILKTMIILISLTFISCCNNKVADVIAIQALAERIIPKHSYKFIFVVEPSKGGRDFFRLEQIGSKIKITGNNSNSMAVGLNYYLKHYAFVYVSWYAHDTIEETKKFPDLTTTIEKEVIVDNRFFLNYCTYGYTMPWWSWHEWERFIDWMALNGINMPLAQTGQEAIWYEVWKDYDMTEEEILSYFSGPAHLPWHRMANLDAFQGPLPINWIKKQKELQKKIVTRERELSMKPVLSAFAGHVPKQIAEKFPKLDIKQLSSWCGFEPTYFLNSEEKLFTEIQEKFITKQTEMYGTDHIYGFDPFNEMDPPSWDTNYLAKISKNIYSSLQKTDSASQWLQMSWVFYYKHKYWTPERLETYLTAVPQNKMILLDYFCENTEVWRLSNKFYGQPYIWCYLGNFGGNTMLVGNINDINEKLTKALEEGGDNLVGVGSTLESFDNSPQIFEFLFEHVWENNIDVEKWIKNWAYLRAGSENINASMAWKILNTRVYKDYSYYGKGTQLDARPSLEGHGTFYTKTYYSYSNKDLLDAYMLLLSMPSKRQSYNYDIINLGSQLLGNYFMYIRNDFTQAYYEGDTKMMNYYIKEANELFEDVDLLLNSNKSFMFGKWIADARANGLTEVEKDYYEKNARTLLTIWGGPILNDYANRMWGGLVLNYYAKRWNLFFEEVKKAVIDNKKFDETVFNIKLVEFENKWINENITFSAEPNGNTYDIAKKIYDKWGDKIVNKELNITK